MRQDLANPRPYNERTSEWGLEQTVTHIGKTLLRHTKVKGKGLLDEKVLFSYRHEHQHLRAYYRHSMLWSVLDLVAKQFPVLVNVQPHQPAV